jgi:predicted PurR-regulated permease PerM
LVRRGQHERGRLSRATASGVGTDPVEGDGSGRALQSPHLALLTLVAGAVVLGVVATVLALWAGRSIVLLLFLSYTLATAISPGVEKLSRRGVPRSLAITGHFALLAAFVGLLLWLFVPVALEQTEQALQSPPPEGDGGVHQTLASLKQQILTGLESELHNLSSPGAAVSATVETLTVLAGIAFTLATTVYWLVERDRLVALVLALVPRSKRTTVRDTWLLIDLKLGAVIRTKLLLVVITGSVLSLAFWLIGVPYFMLVGVFAGVVEVLPVIGPLIAGLAAVAAGLSVSWKVAVAAALVVYGFRVLQDYVINPRLFGHAVQLPPLVVLIAVSAIALLLGPLWVPLAIPITAVCSTLLDVLVWKQDPSEQQVPTVLMRTDDTVARHRRRLWPRRLGGKADSA